MCIRDSLSGIATDDVHKSNMVGKAWTMIKADKLDSESILEALENGCFYATKGPVINNYQMGSDMKIKIECSSCLLYTSSTGTSPM